MRIESFERVVYENNPLAEVVCQVRFEPLGALTESTLETLRQAFSSAGYSNIHEEISLSFAPQVAAEGNAPQVPIVLPQVRIHHFTTNDKYWRASVCSEFVALTCLKYSNWGEFLERLTVILQAAEAGITNARPTRLGLRYKDVIERESLGLADVPWHELIAPFLLGPITPNALAEGQVPLDADIGNFFSHSILRLESSMLLLQSSLLTSTDGQKRAFLIDADFYNEGDVPEDLMTNPDVLPKKLEALHANAGALFRRGITRRLHDALRPTK